MPIAWCPFNKNSDLSRVAVNCGAGVIGLEFPGHRGKNLHQARFARPSISQLLNRVTAFGNRFCRTVDGSLQCANRLLRLLRKHVANCLKSENQSLKALQQRVIQLSRNARAFGQPFFVPYVKLAPYPLQSQVIQATQKQQYENAGENYEPAGLIVSGGDVELVPASHK